MNKKVDFLIWKYSGMISACPEPQALLEAIQTDLDTIKDILKVKDEDNYCEYCKDSLRSGK